MTRHDLLLKISGIMVLPFLALAQQDIIFRARKRGTVFDLTAEYAATEYTSDYGPKLVISLNGQNLGVDPGWNYFVNGIWSRLPAENQIVKPGTIILWRPA